MNKTAKELFEELHYTYGYINNKINNCEDVIIYKNTYLDAIVQFNLLSKCIVYQVDNKWKDYDRIAMFITKELIIAINKQMEDLGWNNENTK